MFCSGVHTLKNDFIIFNWRTWVVNIVSKEPRGMGSLWAGVTGNMLPTMCSGNELSPCVLCESSSANCRVLLQPAGACYSLLPVPRRAIQQMVRKVNRQEFQEEGGPEAGMSSSGQQAARMLMELEGRGWSRPAETRQGLAGTKLLNSGAAWRTKMPPGKWQHLPGRGNSRCEA